MTRKFHTVSIEDREMFAYIKRQRDLEQHLAQPENCIRYCYEFMSVNQKAFEKALDYIAICDNEEAHY